MESYDAQRIRNKAQDLLERLYGDAYEVKILNVQAKEDHITVRGEFSDSWLGEADKEFTITFDKKGNVLDYAVNE